LLLAIAGDLDVLVIAFPMIQIAKGFRGMDTENKTFMLELSYRLTVIVNIKKHGLESEEWVIAWNKETLSRAQDLEDNIRFSLAGKDRFVIAAFIRLIKEIVSELKQGYFAGHGGCL
jgi:hypothetical protein